MEAFGYGTDFVTKVAELLTQAKIAITANPGSAMSLGLTQSLVEARITQNKRL